MIVTLKPVGREEYALKLEAEPSFSSAIFGGYEQAQIACELDDSKRLHARGGRLRIHGETGIVWQGIVTRRPALGEPLVAQGWGIAATFGRREALYCDTTLSPWQERTYEGRNKVLQCQIDGLVRQLTTPRGRTISVGYGSVLRIVMPGGTAVPTGYAGFFRHIPSTSSSLVSFNWRRPTTATRLILWRGVFEPNADTGHEVDANGGVWTAEWTQAAGSGNLSGSVSQAINATHDVLMLTADCPSGYTPASDTSAYFHAVKVYGVPGVTSATTTNVLKDVLANEVDTDYLPSGDEYLSWIETESTAVEPLVFDFCDASTKIDQITKYASYDYGWYTEMVGGAPFCVPHWTQRSTTPDYIVRLNEAEAHDLDESALDELISAVRVRYQSSDGRPRYIDKVDTDTTHPLVALGITRYGDLEVQTTSSVTADTLGGVHLNEKGREQVKGSLTTRYVYTSTGAPAYLPSIRPGQMVRVMGLPDGQRDCIVKRATCQGDKIVQLELDNEPYRLDIALAQLAKREQ